MQEREIYRLSPCSGKSDKGLELIIDLIQTPDNTIIVELIVLRSTISVPHFFDNDNPKGLN